ncbi:hypothetical protein ACFW04_005111 [Cataglyphis niger]
MGPIPFIPFNGDFMTNDPHFMENRNEYYRSYMLFAPTLEDLKNVLYVALNPFFEKFEIEVVSCPCLTKEPYNLAAAGLSGNTGILQMGDFNNFYPRPRMNNVYNMYDILSKYSYDVFVIGSGFATQPFMPYNGHLTMNAIVSANHRIFNNNSCIAYKDVSTGQKKLKIINDYNQIKCCLFGHFFFSEGKRGPVIKMRAKGRRSNTNIYTLIQSALRKCCQNRPIGLGIVFVINGGLTYQFIIPEDFVRCDYNTYKDYFERLRMYKSKCKNLIALGVLTTKRLKAYDLPNGRVLLRDSCSMFNTFSNYESAGEFFNDVRKCPEETEYIVYINIAQERYLVM